MRILWWSNAPWCPTGYGKQTALWAPLLAELGHDVAIGAFHGLHGALTSWRGLPVYPGGRDQWGMDMMAGHYQNWRADLAITLMDTWVMDPRWVAGSGMRLACWTPVDCEPAGVIDRAFLDASGARPVAMSQHGRNQLRAAGLDALYVPHGIDTALFQPPVDRDALRAELGVADRFVIGINAANTDHNRKGFPEQFAAFARFHAKHKDAILLVHAVAENEQWGGLDLRGLAERCGIADAVRFADQYALLSGQIADEEMVSWYGALDVLSACAWGEGFGLPIIEAQACGTPVITTSAAAMPELCGAGWQVSGERFWVSLHGAWWVKPDVAQIARAYALAYQQASRKRAAAREFALGYDVKRVLEDYWEPALAELAGRQTQ